MGQSVIPVRQPGWAALQSRAPGPSSVRLLPRLGLSTLSQYLLWLPFWRFLLLVFHRVLRCRLSRHGHVLGIASSGSALLVSFCSALVYSGWLACLSVHAAAGPCLSVVDLLLLPLLLLACCCWAMLLVCRL